jgi:hypothetical protein
VILERVEDLQKPHPPERAREAQVFPLALDDPAIPPLP